MKVELSFKNLFNSIAFVSSYHIRSISAYSRHKETLGHAPRHFILLKALTQWRHEHIDMLCGETWCVPLRFTTYSTPWPHFHVNISGAESKSNSMSPKQSLEQLRQRERERSGETNVSQLWNVPFGQRRERRKLKLITSALTGLHWWPVGQPREGCRGSDQRRRSSSGRAWRQREPSAPQLACEEANTRRMKVHRVITAWAQ